MEDKPVSEITVSPNQLDNILAELEYIRKKGVQDNYGVSIENFNMPFFALVGLMLKVALASIPAILILAFFGFVISMFFSCGILGALDSLLRSQ
jgi:hypothetical protein